MYLDRVSISAGAFHFSNPVMGGTTEIKSMTPRREMKAIFRDTS